MEDMRLSTLFERLAIGVGMGSFVRFIDCLMVGMSHLWFDFVVGDGKESSEDSTWIGYRIWMDMVALPGYNTLGMKHLKDRNSRFWSMGRVGISPAWKRSKLKNVEAIQSPAGQQHRSLLQVFREGGSPHRPCKPVESLANCTIVAIADSISPFEPPINGPNSEAYEPRVASGFESSAQWPVV